MLGGIIAGALGGGANAINDLADRTIKEAADAKKAAADMGLLIYKANRDDAREKYSQNREDARSLAERNAKTDDIRLKGEIDANTARIRAASEERQASIRSAPKGLEAKLLKLDDAIERETDPNKKAALIERFDRLSTKGNNTIPYGTMKVYDEEAGTTVDAIYNRQTGRRSASPAIEAPLSVEEARRRIQESMKGN